MLSSRAPTAFFNRHESLQSAPKIFRRSYAGSKSKHHNHKPRRALRAKHVRDEKKLDHDYRAAIYQFRREELYHIRQAKQRWREDWDLGPLKPWREAVGAKPIYNNPGGGDGADEVSDFFGHGNNRYGTISQQQLDRFPVVPKHRRIKQWLFRIGDRVCLVEGRDGERGKIGTIEHINYNTERVKVAGVNMVDIRHPEHLLDASERQLNTTEMPVPFRALRLVYPLCDPITKEYRDCILNDLEVRETEPNPYLSFDREERKTFDRYLVPQNIRIPWPEDEEPTGHEHQKDTKRMEVEEKTFIPTLLRPPMPEGAMDQLKRDDEKFDELLKEFDPDQIEKKRQKQEFEEMRKETRQKLLAKGGRNIARGGRSANGEFMRSKELPQFDEATLQVIARHMAAAQSKRAQDAKTTEATPLSTTGTQEPRAPV